MERPGFLVALLGVPVSTWVHVNLGAWSGTPAERVSQQPAPPPTLDNDHNKLTNKNERGGGELDEGQEC